MLRKARLARIPHARPVRRRFRSTGLAVMMCVAACATAAHAGSETYTFINIADNTGDLGNSFNHPSINAEGLVVFAASIGGGQVGIFTGSGGPLNNIVLGGGETGIVSTFANMNDGGDVTYRSSPSALEETIYISDGVGPPTPVVDDSGKPFLAVSLPAINDDNAVAFHGVLTGGVSGIFVAQGFGNYTTIADSSGAFVSFSGRASLNANGVAAFSASTTTDFGIYAGSGGAITTIADTSGAFTSVGNVPSINDSGGVGFFAGNVNVQGIYTGDGGPLTLVADTNGPFAQFTLSDPAINNLGDVAFIANLDAGGKGIFIGPDPATDTVIQIGDPLFGSTLTGLASSIGPRAINDRGDITFTYILENGQMGVAVAVADGPPANPADFNRDGIVDGADLAILLGAWGSCVDCDNCPADLDGNCDVDGADLAILLGNWG